MSRRSLKREVDLSPPLSGAIGGMRVLEMALAALLVAEGVLIPGLGFPLSLIGVAGLTILGFTRPPAQRFGKYAWLFWLFGFLLVWVAAVSILTPPGFYAANWVGRIIRIVAVLALTVMIAQGRLHLPSILKGLLFALVVNAMAFYTGVAPDNYGGYLTGWLGDKNTAGLVYAAVGVLALSQARSRWGQAILVASAGGFIWLTGSRATLAAYGFALLWMALVATRPAVVRWFAAGGILMALPWLVNNFAQAGQFADRSGSDLLRDRIDAAAVEKVAATPPQGLGLGEAYVEIGTNTWYFHNAYDTLHVEGGWLWLAGIVGVTVLFGLRPFVIPDPGVQSRVLQAATLVILISAWWLGEVFLTNAWGLVLGAALNQVLSEQRAAVRAPRRLYPVQS